MQKTLAQVYMIRPYNDNYVVLPSRKLELHEAHVPRANINVND